MLQQAGIEPSVQMSVPEFNFYDAGFYDAGTLIVTCGRTMGPFVAAGNASSRLLSRL